ncbi:hypothetical protein INR49_028155 [Caranx melampygus]|nr:hypothetical protein INR49_028155 [Caranx melampygus]
MLCFPPKHTYSTLIDGYYLTRLICSLGILFSLGVRSRYTTGASSHYSIDAILNIKLAADCLITQH